MRRAIIVGLVFSLIGVGAVPLSGCALMPAKPVDRVHSQTESDCGNMSMDMNMGDDGIQFTAASDKSCCVVSGAPLPEPQYKSSELSLAPLSDADSVSTGHVTRVRKVFPVVVEDSSPPSHQSLLCTFLI